MVAALSEHSLAHLDVSAVAADAPLTVVLFGAAGDLARKKLYPALYQLLYGCPDAQLLPKSTKIVGCDRSPVDLGAFLEKQCVNIPQGEKREQFLKCCYFCAGAYDQEGCFIELHEYLCELEGNKRANRMYFLSVPPTAFKGIARCVHRQARAPDGWTRLIIEKPFGKDSRTFAELNDVTSSIFKEDELFRIDHYLGKETILNLTALRFGNQLFEPLWNAQHIEHVQIAFKEDLGTGGRGGYFDGFGIIRDIMQNHLLQVFMWLAMEPPSCLSREAIQSEKCKLLKSVKTLGMGDCFLGQFGKGSREAKGQMHEEPGYLDDPTVPPGSRCPTYAAAALKVENERWNGVPFLLTAGKGLDERLVEVRVTFKKKEFNELIPDSKPNQLVIRIQPDEAVYMTCSNKVPGWKQTDVKPVDLGMSYRRSFPGSYVADAYERMFLNTNLGDGSLFVGSDELVEAWRIFTPLLDEIDTKQPEPVLYPFGSHLPPGMNEFSARYGITMQETMLEHVTKNETQEKELVPRDAVGSVFGAANMPHRFVYGARAWCSRRGGTVAVAARGSDPQALARALLVPATDSTELTALGASGSLFEELGLEIGLPLVDYIRLRQALHVAARTCTASMVAALATKVDVGPSVVSGSGAKMSNKRAMDMEEVFARICKARKMVNAPTESVRPPLAVMAAAAA